MNWSNLNIAGLMFCFLFPGIIIGLAIGGWYDRDRKRGKRK